MRRSILVALVLVGSAASAKPKKRHVAGPYGASSRVVRSAEAKGEATLRMRSIDLSRHRVVVEITGFPKAPAGNLFYFIDDRGRRFIATDARCDEPFPSGVRVCDLTTPDGYERHPWVGLDLHLHGLENKAVVSAPKEEVARAYEAARTLYDLPAEGPSQADDPPKRPDTPAKAPVDTTDETNAEDEADPTETRE